MSKLAVGDKISILVPGSWQRHGEVVETDYHPLGIDDAVKIKFHDEPGNRTEWFDIRWVYKEATK